MSLDKLPSELVLRVVHQLESPRDLANLALCCQHLHSVVLPILYSSFSKHQHQVLPAFLSTILSRPDLAHYVKSFASSAWGDSRFPSGSLDQHRSNVKDTIEELCDVGDNKGVKDRWYEDFYSRENWNAVTAFILLLVPNLTTIKLLNCPRRTDWISKILRRACDFQTSNTTSPFSPSNLHSVELAASSVDGDYAIPSMIMPFLELRSLRRFTCHAFCFAEYYVARLEERLGGRTSGITILHFPIPTSVHGYSLTF